MRYINPKFGYYPEFKSNDISVGYPRTDGPHLLTMGGGLGVKLVQVEIKIRDITTGEDISQDVFESDACSGFLFWIPPDEWCDEYRASLDELADYATRWADLKEADK